MNVNPNISAKFQWVDHDKQGAPGAQLISWLYDATLISERLNWLLNKFPSSLYSSKHLKLLKNENIMKTIKKGFTPESVFLSFTCMKQKSHRLFLFEDLASECGQIDLVIQKAMSRAEGSTESQRDRGKHMSRATDSCGRFHWSGANTHLLDFTYDIFLLFWFSRFVIVLFADLGLYLPLGL